MLLLKKQPQYLAASSRAIWEKTKYNMALLGQLVLICMFKSHVVVAVFCVVFLSCTLFTCIPEADSTPASSSPAPTELWSYVAPNTTSSTIRMSWRAPQIGDDVVTILNDEIHTVLDGRDYPYGPPQHLIETLYALDAKSGAKLWNFTDLSSILYPVMVDDVVYFCASQHLYAVDAKSGSQKWVHDIGAEFGFMCPPKVANDTVYVVSHTRGGEDLGYVFALNAANGELLWRNDVAPGNRAATLNVGGDLVYFSGPNGCIYALDPADGAVQWKVETDTKHTLPPVASGGAMYFSTIDQFYAIDASDGSELWRYDRSIGSSGSPVFSGGIVYLNSPDPPYLLGCSYGNVYAFDATNGLKLWNYSYPTRLSGMSHLEVSNGVAYFHSRDALFALSAGNGSELWSQNIVDVTSFSVGNGVVYYNSGTTFGALDAANGDTLWIHTTSGTQSPLTVADGVAYFGAGNTVYALDVSAERPPISEQPWLDATSTTTLIIIAAVVIGLVTVLAAVLSRRKGVRATLG